MDEIDNSKQQSFPSLSTDVDQVLQHLPEAVLAQIKSYAESQGWSVLQVIEFAFASFLNHDTVSFGQISDVQTPGQLKEKVAILNLQLKAAQKALAEAGIPDPSTQT